MANVELLDKGWLEHNLGTGSILTLLSDPELFQKFLDAYYIDGSDYYDQKAYSALSNLLSRRIGEANTANQKIAALLAALVVLQIAGTSYLNHNNHLATAFLCAESAMLISQNCLRYQLPYNALQNSRHLIYDHFEYALNELAREALQSEHMLGVKHDLENSYFWRVRATLVCGAIAFLSLLHRHRHSTPHQHETEHINLIIKHQFDLIIWSESAIPFYFAIYMLLRARPQFTIIGENILLRYFASVSHRLRDESTRSRRFDVYFNVLDALLDPLNSETNSETRYSSQSYTLYPCILLLRRALRRQTLSVFWYDLYKITFLEMKDIAPYDLYCERSESGTLTNHFLATPTSWQALQDEADSISADSVEYLQCSGNDPIALLLMLFRYPHRFNSLHAILLDDIYV